MSQMQKVILPETHSLWKAVRQEEKIRNRSSRSSPKKARPEAPESDGTILVKDSKGRLVRCKIF